MKKFISKYGIASWKIDSPIERFLSHKADNSNFWKKLYVKYYDIFDHKYYKNGLKFIDKNISLFVGEVSREKRKQYLIDMIYSLHRFGCMFDEYFLFDFPKLNANGRETFVTDKNRWDLYSKMNLDDNQKIFQDKFYCYKKFNKYYGRDMIRIESQSDKDSLIEFIKRHKNFIVKPCNGSGGVGIRIVHLNGDEDNQIIDELLKGQHVVEELINQSDLMGAWHKNSVNTVRIYTIRNNEGVHILKAFIRTGYGDAVVDNASHGGIFALIDPSTGIIHTKGFDKKRNEYMRHPNSNIVFPGFQIPQWDELKRMVSELSYVVETNRYCGWDLAHTNNGWIMVEGNECAQMAAMQVATKQGILLEVLQLMNR